MLDNLTPLAERYPALAWDVARDVAEETHRLDNLYAECIRLDCWNEAHGVATANNLLDRVAGVGIETDTIHLLGILRRSFR